MAFPQGINFRASSGYVTDGTGDAYEIGTTANYPRTTAQGNTVGWEDAITGSRDRAVQDARLSGIHFLTSTSGLFARFRVDLPSVGNWNIRLAAGDATSTQYSQIELFDTTTSLGVMVNRPSGTAIVTNSFVDATNTEYTYANWLTSNTAVSKTFASTIARFRIGAGNGQNSAIAHLRVEAVAGGPATFSYTGLGGYTFSGTTTKLREAIKSASGGITVSGNSPQLRGASRTPSGGLITGGTGTALRSRIKTATGGLLMAGAASLTFFASVQSLVVSAAGGITFSGTATRARGVVRTLSGGLIFGGSSATTLTPDPNPVGVRAFKRGRRPRTRKNY